MTQDLDILSFDTVKLSEHDHEFELKHPDGVTGTGIKLKVIGKHADVVTKFTDRLVNEQQRQAMLAHKSGKAMPPKPMEELRAQNIEAAALRVTGWSGVKQEFSQDTMRRALARNPHWIDQIIEESDTIGNFFKPQ
jgi:hypothetical protein